MMSPPDPLNLGQVRAFLAVVDARGFHDAATALGCAQPTVSQLLRKLEEALGACLILRGHAESIPTAAGRRFVPIARSLLRAEQRAREAVTGGQLIVGASSNIGIYLLPQQLKRVRDMVGQPLEMRIGSNPETANRLETGEVDVAVMEWWDDRPGFKAMDWRRERLVVIVPPDHRWASRRAITVDDLLTTELLGGETGSGTGTLLRHVLGSRAADLRTGRNLGSTEAVKQAVKAGLGVSLVLAGAVTEEARHGSLVALDLEDVRLEKTLCIVVSTDVPRSAPARRFATSLAA